MEKLKSATGRRKASVARVFIDHGKGAITINGKEYTEYFPIKYLQDQVELPLKTIEGIDKFDININVKGGGIKGQAEAVKLAIARALLTLDGELRPTLKDAGLLRRDSRVVERKKPGLRKARKKSQFSKR